MTLSVGRPSALVSGGNAAVTRDCTLTLFSPFNFPIHFPHIVRSEFCSGLIHHLMRATKSLLKSFPNNTFWRLQPIRNISLPSFLFTTIYYVSLTSVLVRFHLHYFLHYVYMGEWSQCCKVIRLWFYVILTSKTVDFIKCGHWLMAQS